MCVFSVCFLPTFWTSSSLDVPAGVTQEEGHTGFLIHLPSAVRALIFVARRIRVRLPNLLVINCTRGKYIDYICTGTASIAVCIGLYTRYQYIFYLGACTFVHGSLLYMHICVTTAVCM